MNFFAQQEHARKLTFRLLGFMLLAVIVLILLTTLLVAIFIYYFKSHATSISAVQAYRQDFASHALNIFQSETFLWVALAISALVFLGSCYKHLSLRQGGSKIAMALGGHLLQPDTQDLNEKKLQNIVEEMAIASGSPMPNIFVIPEPGINAFAAGHNPQSALIGVTRGCIETLSRDELQGVIAHEFSHIHNGDMKLNLKLIAILHGILLIGLIGNMLLRGSFWGHSASGRRNNGNKTAILGVALVAIGYGGTFFGKLIKAAVSRQREFLADASAVQFTRNPLGIGGALNKIALHSNQSTIKHPRAQEFSHMYFAKALNSGLSNWFATHPPIHDRLTRIFPRGIPEFKISKPERKNQTAKTEVNELKGNPLHNASAVTPVVIGALGEAIDHIGEIHTNTQDKPSLRQQFPKNIIDASHNAYSARAIIYALVLNNTPELKERQINYLRSRANPRTFSIFQDIQKDVCAIDLSLRMPLMEMSLPSLSNLSKIQDTHFKRILTELIKTGRKPKLFSWCVYQRIINHNQNISSPSHTFDDLLTPTSTLLACIASLSIKGEQSGAFLAGYKCIWPQHKTAESDIQLLNKNNISLSQWSSSLKELRTLRLLARPTLLKAIAKIVEYDKRISQEEWDCFRLIASVLDCPIPNLSLSPLSA